MSKKDGAGEAEGICGASSCPSGGHHAGGGLGCLHPDSQSFSSTNSRAGSAELSCLHCLMFLTNAAVYQIVYIKGSFWL